MKIKLLSYLVLFGLILQFNPIAQAQSSITAQRVIDYQRIHLNVKNLDSSISAYQNVLGMELFRYRPSMNGEFLGTDPGSRLRTASLRVPTGDFEIELIEWTGSNHRSEFRDYADPGMVMFSFTVNDLETKVDGLRRLGWTVVTAGGEPVYDEGRTSIVLRDQNAFFLELLADPGGSPSIVSIRDAKLWMTVNDLSETANFYNRVFGFNLPLNSSLQLLSETQKRLFNTPDDVQYRLSTGAFAGIDFPEIRFQEFRGVDKRGPLRHRVQDYGGPTIPIVVNANDLRQTLIDIKDNGGIIGQEDISVTVPEVVEGTWWARDPNGILYQVEAP